jgi:hypothetical protein
VPILRLRARECWQSRASDGWQEDEVDIGYVLQSLQYLPCQSLLACSAPLEFCDSVLIGSGRSNRPTSFARPNLLLLFRALRTLPFRDHHPPRRRPRIRSSASNRRNLHHQPCSDDQDHPVSPVHVFCENSMATLSCRNKVDPVARARPNPIPAWRAGLVLDPRHCNIEQAGRPTLITRGDI